MASGRRSRQNSLPSGSASTCQPSVSKLTDVGRAGSGGQEPGQFGVLAGADRAQADVQAEQPSHQDRCLGYDLINAGRRAVGTANVKPRNGLIAFMRPGTVGEHDIWVVQPDGTGLRRVTQSPANGSDYYRAWSPDGSAFLFERRKLDPAAAGGDEALYAGNARRRFPPDHPLPRRLLVGWRGRLVARRGPDRLQPRHRPRSAPRPSRVAIDVANRDGGPADEIDAASAEAAKGLRAYGHSWPRLAPGSASPARPLSNAGDNVASPAMPHDNDRR